MTTVMTEKEPSAESLISVDVVTFGYGNVSVLESVSIDVESGSFLGLIGPNGSDKSTLLDLMLGLRRPSEGTVSLFGEPAHEFDAGERIGYVAQDATKVARDTSVTVQEVVEMRRYPWRLFGRFSVEDRRAVDEPTVGVDAESREEFYSLLAGLNATGLTVILIEHDIGVVTTYATDIRCLNRQLYFDGDPSAFVETDALAQAYGTDQHVLYHDH
ncbi:cobalamin import ATP-binding protein BtuD [Halalkalicoccus paucihalophilus]|uniref:Cobalamin import ATP-binding protein BtuD n=1 Tax=Halalkalicoccus paucihalophilus TaxID=1008153 RepID=A0A151A8L4_9EURY|nr:metal ABC transporter ATP-binding protein [Halalkalicoccus paucihalophilus]KYH23959.1 cobalamin import ATP-binding protein BtuD [Halalkalicoccus paucihalophilus]